MTGWAWLNGAIVPEDEARISIWDRGFLYGDGVFETLRVYDGAPFQLEAHLRRLGRGAARLGIDGAPPVEALRAAVEALVARAEPGDALLRLMITRGPSPGGWRGACADGPTVLVVLRPTPLPPADWYARGVTAVWCDVPMMQAPWWPSDVKHCNWLPRILAKRQVDAAGADEGFLRTPGGLLAEGLSSNVFVAQAGALRTPPPGDGALPGVTRDVVLRLAACAGIAAQEAAVPAAAVAAADEIVCTNAGLGPYAVVALHGRPVGTGAPGPLWRRLREAYVREARA